MGVKHVITTEGDPKSAWGHKLTYEQKVFIIAEKLYEPLRLAGDLGVSILLEPHGILTDSIHGMQAIIDALGAPGQLGRQPGHGQFLAGRRRSGRVCAGSSKTRSCTSTGRTCPPTGPPQRGTIYGCGFGPIALGEGAIDIAGVYAVLQGRTQCRV